MCTGTLFIKTDSYRNCKLQTKAVKQVASKAVVVSVVTIGSTAHGFWFGQPKSMLVTFTQHIANYVLLA